MKATKAIINEILLKGEITEKEILLLKKRANHGDKEAAMFYPSYDTEILVSEEQSKKGYAWLWNLYKSPTGKERKNNPFGWREINILEKSANERFTFVGFYNAGNRYVDSYTPIYNLGGMEYYVSSKGIEIVG